MIEVSAVVGGLEVGATGVLHVYGHSIVAKINGMEMEIRFVSAEPASDTRFYTEVKEGTLFLNLQNFSSPFPEGQFEPTVIGTINGRALLMSFSVVTLDKSRDARLFTYTFYLGGERA
ncbi:DUF6864 domain-containing function [Pseudomonas parafulva]|uniref:DUF6864 domain-containing function n=1 Tax=Pseudomonas parafulva TaxID=157782 RepID=UPI000A5897C2|nr:hypothetical protein [Pseudomonas parafulva]